MNGSPSSNSSGTASELASGCESGSTASSGSERSTSVLRRVVDRRAEEAEVERAVEEPRDLGRGQQLALKVEHHPGEPRPRAAASAGSIA